MFTLFFLVISFDVSAQLIKGQILIYGTEDPLPNASIYYDGSYKGGISDSAGNFQLAPIPAGKNPIVISAIGYHSTSIADYTSEEFIKIYLQPKTYVLDAVVVTYDGMSREEKEAIFKTEFIGVSENSRQTEIINIDDINLVYNRKRQTIEAFSEEPILLHNKALGFKITYYLDQFRQSPENLYFSGNYFFEPDTTLSGKNLKRVERKRREAYLGSRMHFIRSLYNDRLREDGYNLLNLSREKADNSGMVVYTESGRSLFIKSRLAVIYKGNQRTTTFLDKTKDFTFIAKNGFYDPGGIVWSGSMANQRMGDLLPFEYEDSRNRKP
ncbi:carboxypeptidase-like regulatory domain-containing protein [Daejeonella sp.]|uniref:carboxypeptidase-like regulatory domain-containing protein n=1 Tax=Daejeonella sp. TaxID=2805397 RepID=UPI0030C5CB8F